ncbi:hypothetical protein MZO42_02700 [Sphingomonas psychrotolerans]|uniref:Uncharacterized protein n=1 Tax=Sphingomonas psychrotolerans TaxID=1327635 RepID=A0ABU3MZE2_9SPHN|nr:hypothetical protein [Sphingomonas psychrotolerans]MDT8757597.1 hypothetical protein [Sphingomonas psychrotolerans]
MNLLLLLTALLASLTGTGPADRNLRGVQDVAVVRAAEAVEAVSQSAGAVRPAHPVADADTAPGQHWAVAEAAALPGAEQRFERRLE